MKNSSIFIYLLALVSAWYFKSEAKTVEYAPPIKAPNLTILAKNSNYQTKNKNSGTIIPEANLFPSINEHTINATPEQKLAAEECAKRLREAYADESEKSNNKGVLNGGTFKSPLINKNGKFTEQEITQLKSIRNTAIKESSMNRQIHPEETIIDRSDMDGKYYLFSYSYEIPIVYDISWGNALTASYWTCPGDRMMFNTIDKQYGYGDIEFGNIAYQDSWTGNYVVPSSYQNFSVTTSTSYRSAKGAYVEFVNEMEHCGMFSIYFRCGQSYNYGGYCGTTLTQKFYHYHSGDTVPTIYKQERIEPPKEQCYDQSKYFCSSTSCLPTLPSMINVTNWSDWVSVFCATKFGGFGARCPQNATCMLDGHYYCHPGFKDAFSLNHMISDNNDCTACQMTRGCIPDDTDYHQIEPRHVFYNVSNSFSNSLEHSMVQLDSFCGKSLIVNGCTDDQFGDQYIELLYMDGNRVAVNDDIYNNRICSRILSTDQMTWMCANGYLRLGCFGQNSCGGTVDITIGDPCDVDTYSPTGLKPCVACPVGRSADGTGNMYCTRCSMGYIGINGTAPCVPCPDGFMELNHTTCEPCNVNILHTLTGYMYDQCLATLLTKVDTLQERVSSLIGTFDQYLEDVKYGAPTVAPTARPTRRRRSQAPTNAVGM